MVKEGISSGRIVFWVSPLPSISSWNYLAVQTFTPFDWTIRFVTQDILLYSTALYCYFLYLSFIGRILMMALVVPKSTVTTIHCCIGSAKRKKKRGVLSYSSERWFVVSSRCCLGYCNLTPSKTVGFYQQLPVEKV